MACKTHIAHIAHIARSPETVGVQRLGAASMPGRWRGRGGFYAGQAPARSVLDFESFAGRGQMLDGRVLGASQVEYKPFGKPPLKREPEESVNLAATCKHVIA